MSTCPDIMALAAGAAQEADEYRNLKSRGPFQPAMSAECLSELLLHSPLCDLGGGSGRLLT